MPNSIPLDVLRFIDANVDSVEQLEILRVLSEAPSQRRLARELAGACQIHMADIARHLSILERRGLLTKQHQQSDESCVYAQDSDEKAEVLGRLLQCYRERPVTLIRVVYERLDQRLAAFSDAFRLRKNGQS